jgi:hypothetical protein
MVRLRPPLLGAAALALGVLCGMAVAAEDQPAGVDEGSVAVGVSDATGGGGDASGKKKMVCPPCVDNKAWTSPDGWGVCSTYVIGGPNEGYCADDGAHLQCRRSCANCPPCTEAERGLSTGLTLLSWVLGLACLGVPLLRFIYGKWMEGRQRVAEQQGQLGPLDMRRIESKRKDDESKAMAKAAAQAEKAAKQIAKAEAKKLQSQEKLAAALVSGGMGSASPRGATDPAFGELDINGDGVITREEFGTGRQLEFDAMDRNGDGMLSEREFGVAGAAPVVATPGERGGVTLRPLDLGGSPAASNASTTRKAAADVFTTR